MKDTSRPRPTQSSRSAPYRKCNPSNTVSPTRGTRRENNASQSQARAREMISPRPPDRTHGPRHDEAQPSSAISPAREHRPLSNTGGNCINVSRIRRYASMDESLRERPPHMSALSTHADLPGPSLRLPLASASPAASTPSAGQGRAGSPPPGSATVFARSIRLPDKPSGAPPLQTSVALTTPPSPHHPPLSTDSTDRDTSPNGNDYQVSLVYKGYPFSYDLTALPEDPKGTIELLSITKSDPGAYILVGAHYRRTGRSRAACAVIRSLLDSLDTPSSVEKGKGDAAPVPVSETPTVILDSPGSPCPKQTVQTASAFKSAAMRPAMLLLAACELDISREHPDDPESARHASTAHDLFRAVYGTVNDATIAGAIRPQPPNTLGHEFSSNRNCPSYSPSHLNGHPSVNSALPHKLDSLTAHVKELEKELGATRAAQKKLQDKLSVSGERLARAEGKARALESHSRELLAQLDSCRDENWELRRRLADSEQKTKELAECVPSAESRVWGRLRDLLFDNLGGGARGE